METNKNIERIFELLEIFDFSELSEQDKLFVLSEMTEIEYSNMRSTIKDTQSFFDQDIEQTYDHSRNPKNLLISILKQPVQLYKVAASVIILIGAYSVIHYFNFSGNSNLLTLNDKTYINKTDTIYSKTGDTITIVKEKIIYLPKEIEVSMSAKLLSNSKNEYDCKNEICPNDIDRIKDLSYNDNASKDTLLRDIIALVK